MSWVIFFQKIGPKHGTFPGFGPLYLNTGFLFQIFKCRFQFGFCCWLQRFRNVVNLVVVNYDVFLAEVQLVADFCGENQFSSLPDGDFFIDEQIFGQIEFQREHGFMVFQHYKSQRVRQTELFSNLHVDFCWRVG